jgi:two-component system, NarL family, invasion response regulator UvrY
MRILICDDHKIVRDGLRQILRQIQEVTDIDEAKDGSEAISIILKSDFDVVLLDISLPDKNGLEVLKSIKAKSPSTKVLMLSMHSQEQYAKRSFNLGASGYLTKDAASEELILAVRRISEGGKYISQSLAENIVLSFADGQDMQKPRHEMLSGREFEIMLKIAKGLSLKDIGNELFISVKTVSTYRTRIMEKMQMSRNADLTMYCLDTGLI